MSTFATELEPAADIESELPEVSAVPVLECLIELRRMDRASGVEFRDCLIDYTRCPNNQCIKKLL